MILQHVGERFHAFNTARIVQHSLKRCRLITDHNRRLGTHHLPIQANAGLLYPGADAPSLAELPASERPSQLVIIDGTWHQAKTVVRDVPQLQSLPCYRLNPSAPGQYRIRREPNAESLSTVEATVAALQALEPDTIGLEHLLAAFHRMVEDQLAHPAGRVAWRQKKSRQSRPRFLPQAILQNADNLVVAYGEAMPGGPNENSNVRTPVNWVAQRLGTTQRFCCCLQQEHPLSGKALQHMKLSPADWNSAISQDEFRDRWSRFLRRNDVLIVYHERTYQLLRSIAAQQPRCLVLKSIFGKWRSGFRSPEQLIATEGVAMPKRSNGSRANDRLAMAVALVEHLRKQADDLK